MLTKCSIANILYIFLLFIQKGKLRNAPTNIELAFMTQNCSLVPCYSIPNDYTVGLYSQSFSFLYLLMRDLQWSVQSSYCYCNASVRMTPVAGVGSRCGISSGNSFQSCHKHLYLAMNRKNFGGQGQCDLHPILLNTILLDKLKEFLQILQKCTFVRKRWVVGGEQQLKLIDCNKYGMLFNLHKWI